LAGRNRKAPRAPVTALNLSLKTPYQRGPEVESGLMHPEARVPIRMNLRATLDLACDF
jgi:hypothetical protein